MDDIKDKLVDIVFKSLCNHIHKSCKLAENITDDLIANGVRLEEKQATSDESKWISVAKDKPKKRGHYFVAYRFEGSDMCFYGAAMWR